MISTHQRWFLHRLKGEAFGEVGEHPLDIDKGFIHSINFVIIHNVDL